MPTYSGSCHCGDVRFEVEAQIDHVRSCDCSVCTKRGALNHRVPKDNLRLLTRPMFSRRTRDVIESRETTTADLRIVRGDIGAMCIIRRREVDARREVG